MKAIRVHEFGEPDVMKLEEVPDPVAGVGEVVVRLYAVGVNPVDTYIRAGRYGSMVNPPYTPGMDGAGVVEAVGDGVENVGVGDRVYAAGLTNNAYAERVLWKAGYARRLPDAVSFAQGAALNVPYGTAFRALFQRARTQSGESVMIHGGSGGVGLAAIQMARARGLTVAATAGSAVGLQLIEEQGAKYVLDHNDPEYVSDALGATCGRGFDVILEMAAHLNLGHDLELLAPGGRVVIIGSRGEVTIDPRHTMAKGSAILGMRFFDTPPQDFHEIFDGIDAGLADGTLRPVIAQEFALADAPRAHEAVLQPGARGKIVLIP
ncbi:MAG TPA: NADPH:quinone reductase [Abditibacteriaceae bacterium]|jgi:NADPH2:quinone reductase